MHLRLTRPTRMAVSASPLPSAESARARPVASSSQFAQTMRDLMRRRTCHPWAASCPASSGRTARHRLNRGGDRALNRAIHAIALVRMRGCPRTRAYVARRTAEGKPPREIRHCLKRYIARELHRQLTRSTNLPAGP